MPNCIWFFANTYVCTTKKTMNSLSQHEVGRVKDGTTWGTQQSKLQNHSSTGSFGNDKCSIRESWCL